MPDNDRAPFKPLEHPDAIYTHHDAMALSKQLRRLLITASIYFIIIIAGIIPTLILRIQLATIAVTVVMGGLGLFIWGMKITPVLGYRKHLREIHSGLSREVTGRLTRVESDRTTFREGIDCYPFIININMDASMPDDPKDERLLYWDAQKPMPAWHEGDCLIMTAHGNDVIAIKVMSAITNTPGKSTGIGGRS